MEVQEISKSNLENQLANKLSLAHLLSEKCELKRAEEAYLEVFEEANRSKNSQIVLEAILGVFRIAGEALDEEKMQYWERQLDQFIAQSGTSHPLVYYCKGAIARQREQHKEAKKLFLKFLSLVKAGEFVPILSTNICADTWIARARLMLANLCLVKRKARRASLICTLVLDKYESKNLSAVNGVAYLTIAQIKMEARDFEAAKVWLQKAQVAFLSERNWYYHLYTLKFHAKIARLQQNYPAAYWDLDLISKIAAGPEFGLIRREVKLELAKLQQDAVDLLIDGRKGLIKTRDGGEISLRKQYVLLGILGALFDAHKKNGADEERGLSKAEIIEKVWRESYRPEAHDNKLYYNINRLRKLIEPDMRQPQYLLNWKEGYRLAPGLRVRFLNSDTSLNLGDEQNGSARHH